MNKSELKHRPTVLIVLDGWGVAIPSQANAITQAKTPNFDSFVARFPTVTLQASGEATGLPWGEVGNSEVGHMSIGAGRIVYQELSRINNAISSGTFFSNEAFLAAIEHVKKNNSTLHCISMVSSGGVHSHIDHLYALLELLHTKAVPSVAIHVFLDGRDTPYASGLGFVQRLKEKILGMAGTEIASIGGRYYGMDRDNHWDREEKAYRAIVEGVSEQTATDPCAAIEQSYAQKIYDEEFVPQVITKDGKAVAQIRDNDAVIFLNIRADRARQLVTSITNPLFDKFPRKQLKNLCVVTMTSYDKRFPVTVAFQPQSIKNCLSEIIANAGLQQLHVAETEKYAHITYFLNDGREEPFVGEKRSMLPSPAVQSYDVKPEMSAREITATITKALESDEYDFIAVNFANADMVGHTGNLKATITAVETIDQCLGLLIPRILAKSGACLITADHGNAETLIDLKTGRIDKEHSNNPVPCIVIAKDYEGQSFAQGDVHNKDLSIFEASGMLSDVAPTLLDLMGIPKPPEMTGTSLLKNN
ncbi:MAG: 2,3-bisphosphoglycerate-independent phosphoglycerate mutase [bacterium]|nr:2,3-bisphosphoglycerate-independent phosphoglycerate mutase [bacterium]